MFWPFNHYPGSDYETFNYDWVIGKLKELKDSVAAAYASEIASKDSEISAKNSELAAANSESVAVNSAAAAQNNANLLSDTIEQVELNTARIDNLVDDPGSIDSDAELTDARITWEADTLSSAGNAVRAQTKGAYDVATGFKSYVNSEIGNLATDEETVINVTGWEMGQYSDSGVKQNANNRIRTGLFMLPQKEVTVYADGRYQFIIQSWKNDGTHIERMTGWLRSYTFTPEPGYYYTLECVYDTFIQIDVTAGANIHYKYNPLFGTVNAYPEIKDYNKKDVFLGNWYAFNSASSLSGNVCTITGANGGMITGNFTATSDAVAIEIDANYTVANLTVTVACRTAGGTDTYKTLKQFTGGSVNTTVYFDAVSYMIHDNAVSFRVLLQRVGTTESGTITLNNFHIYDLTNLQKRELYDQNFENMMVNVMDAIVTNNASETDSGYYTLATPGGVKVSLMADANNHIKLVPNIPDTVAYLGNSILMGIDESNQHGGPFGMAASDYTKDYRYITNQAITSARGSAATDNIISIYPFESAGNLTTARNYISTNRAAWTNKDMVIVQCGDNVNSPIQQTVFETSFGELLADIRDKSPDARIFVVGIWFNKETVLDTMMKMASKYGCAFVNIKDLYKQVNMPDSTQIITYRDNTTFTIPTNWLTHPGDAGMYAIANRLINAMNL